MSRGSKLKHNFGANGGPFKPQPTNQGAKIVSDKDSKKDFTTATSMDLAEATALRLALFEKENLELRQQVLQSNVEKAQLQAQLQSDKIKEGLDKANKTVEGLLATVGKKYGLDLAKDKVDLTTGAITRAKVEAEATEDSE